MQSAKIIALALAMLFCSAAFAQKKGGKSQKNKNTESYEAKPKKKIEDGDKKMKEAEATKEAAKKKAEPVFEFKLPEYDIVQAETEIPRGTFNSYYIELPEAEFEEVKKRWSKWMKKNKGDVDESLGLLTAENVKLKELSENESKVYASFKVVGAGVGITSLVDLGDDFLSGKSYPQISAVYETKLKEFALQFAKEKVEDELKVEEKMLKEYESDLKKLNKEGEKLAKDLEKYTQAVIDTERGIETNGAAKIPAREKIDAQSKVVERVKRKLSVFD